MTRCEKVGHKWRQKVGGVLGRDVCCRCHVERVNPRAVPERHEIP